MIKNRIIELAESLLEDINIFGANYIITVYIDKASNNMNDYDIDKEKIIYMDEYSFKCTLFECLVFIIHQDYLSSSKESSRLSCCVKAIRNISGIRTLVEFAKKHSIALRTIEDWDSSRRNIPINKLMELASVYNIDKATILTTVYDSRFYKNS